VVAQEVTLKNKLGLHARPAAHLVRLASQYKSQVFLVKDDTRINAKSIMGVMMLAAEQGAALTIECQGEDEEELLAKLVQLVEDKFYEE
jgi:phosphocarrier protein HPr